VCQLADPVLSVAGCAMRDVVLMCELCTCGIGSAREDPASFGLDGDLFGS